MVVMYNYYKFATGITTGISTTHLDPSGCCLPPSEMEMINITTSFLHIAALIVATLLLIKGFYFLRRRPHLNLPPGPKPWPIIGHLNLLGSLPHRSIHSLSKKYGPLMRLQFGSQPVIVASSIDMVKQILQTQDINFLERPLTTAGKYTSYNSSDIVWARYGPYWRQARKMCIMELFTTKSLESYEYIRVEETRGLIRSIHMSHGKEINLKDHVYDVGLNVMSRVVLGSKKYLGNGEGKSDPSILNTVEFKEMLDEWSFLSGVITIGDSIPWLGFLDLDGYVKRMTKLGKKFNKFFDHVIDEHNERRRREGVKFVAKCMIDVLLQSTDDNDIDPDAKLTRPRVKAICQNMFTGGTDTSIVTLEWAISELLKKPEIFLKATEELDRVIGRERWVEEKDIPNLPFIESIIKETMRLHPVAPFLIPRLSREYCQINGYDIPAGTRALVMVWSVARDPTLWENPEEFCPERFIGKDIDIKGHDFELLPFGAGRRMCPAYPLGLKVIQTSLANLLHGFVWKLPGKMKSEDLNMEECFGLSTPKKIRLVVVAEPRLPPHVY